MSVSILYSLPFAKSPRVAVWANKSHTPVMWARLSLYSPGDCTVRLNLHFFALFTAASASYSGWLDISLLCHLLLPRISSLCHLFLYFLMYITSYCCCWANNSDSAQNNNQMIHESRMNNARTKERHTRRRLLRQGCDGGGFCLSFFAFSLDLSISSLFYAGE